MKTERRPSREVLSPGPRSPGSREGTGARLSPRQDPSAKCRPCIQGRTPATRTPGGGERLKRPSGNPWGDVATRGRAPHTPRARTRATCSNPRHLGQRCLAAAPGPSRSRSRSRTQFQPVPGRDSLAVERSVQFTERGHRPGAASPPAAGPSSRRWVSSGAPRRPEPQRVRTLRRRPCSPTHERADARQTPSHARGRRGTRPSRSASSTPARLGLPSVPARGGP